ncbi:MAG: zinc ABC transporter substrate-binding protein [Gemmatimonadetes bacterium]|nr:zinc ABC transporter substrate-binding protein [Gemmatimonadota bacterium]
MRLRSILTFWAATLAGTAAASPGSAAAVPASPAPVRVVTTLPVYASILREIGGDQLVVSAIADPHEDAHFVRPKPSFAAELRRADVFVTTGLDLELWAPVLLDKAGNARVSEGGPGHVTTYPGIKLLDIPAAADRAAGDIHLYGNPHLYTDPLNAIQIARNMVAGLKAVAPERSAVWDRGLADFTVRIHRRLFGARLVELVGGETLASLARSGKLHSFLEQTPYQGTPLIRYLGGWLAVAEPFRGKDIICYHKDWAYFEDRFQVRCAEYVEPKPGIPPTPRHVARLIDLMKTRSIRLIIAGTYYGRAKVARVAERAGASYLMVPFQPGALPGVDSYFDMVDAWVSGLGEAFKGGKA